MRTRDSLPVENRLIFSLFDYSGSWPKPYADAGYPTDLWDYKVEGCCIEGFSRICDRIDECIEVGYMPYGLLMAPPCTDLSKAGAWTWADKDKRMHEDHDFLTVTDWAECLVMIGFELSRRYDWKFWALENPPGRLERICPELSFYRRMMFNPFDYGDPYTKKTVLWGEFNTNLPKNPVEPERVLIKGGSNYYHASSIWAKTGGRSEKTKTLRSNTPAGFARAFYAANP
jgi:hypothetical protein